MFIDQINIEWMCYNCFILWCVSGSKASLACIWHEEQFYTAGPLLQNGTVGLADGKPWVSMLLSWNGFTMPPCIAFLAFRLSTNAPLMLITVVLLSLYVCCVLSIMDNCICMSLPQSSVRTSYSVVQLF